MSTEGQNRYPVAKKLVAVCLEEVAAFTQDVIDRACEQYPDRADALRHGFDALRRSGLLGPMAGVEHIAGRAPDPWGAGEREAFSDPDAELAAVGPYQPLKVLGRGGQAVVYLAEDARLHRPVALKILTGLGPLSETTINRFRREAEVASKLDHPGICAVYDAGVEDGVPYIAMRCVQGVSLAERISEAQHKRPDGVAGEDSTLSLGSATPTELNRVLEVMEKSARTLHAAHEAGVVHRDVKPGNIMVTPTGEPVLLDFGLAAAEDGGLITLTETGDVLGTPAYMSPEQLMAKRIRLDRRTDVYSLGVTLFECLTLQRPFQAKTREEMYQAIQYKDPTDIRSLNAGLSTDLRVVVETALEKDRDKRYQTAEEFAEDLRRLRENEPIAARPVSAVGRAWRSVKRRPMRAALFVLLAIGLPIVTSLTGYLVANAPKIRAAEAQALLEKVERHLEDGYTELAHGDPTVAISSFDAALALHASSGEAVGGKALALVHVKKYAECLKLLDEHETVVAGEWAFARIRAEVLRRLGREGAAGDLEKNAPEGPRTPLGFFLAGSRLMRGCREQTDKNTFRTALGYFRRATLTASHARPLYHFQLAHAAGHLKDPETAREVGDSLLALWPESSDALGWAGYAVALVDVERSIHVLQKAAALNPDDSTLLYNLASSLLETGRLDAAIAVLRRVIVLKPGYPKAHSRLALALQQNGDSDGAIAALRVSIKRDAGNAAAHLNLGVILRGRGELTAAIAAFRTAIALKPRYATAHYNLGVTLGENGEVTASIAAFRTVIALKPDHSEAHYCLGSALYQNGDFDGAIAAHRNAVSLKPDDVRAHRGLGSALFEAGELSAAIAAYREWVQRDAGNAEAHFDLGAALDENGDFTAAIAAYRAAIALKPNYAKAHYNLGTTLGVNGEFTAAIAAFQEAITLKPDHADAHFNLGSALFKKGDSAAAIAAYRRAVSLKPDHADAHSLLGSALYQNGDFGEAVAAHRRAVALRPDDAVAHYSLGTALSAEGEVVAAIAAYRESIKRNAGIAEAHFELGNALVLKGELEAALAAFQEAVALKPDFARAHHNVGATLQRQGKLTAAIAAYRRAIALQPDLAASYNDLGVALVRKGQWGAAIAAYERAVSLDPLSASSNENLARALAQQGELDAAVAAYRKAIALKPPNVARLHYSLGIALRKNGELEAAVAAYRNAIALKPPNVARLHYNLGHALEENGELEAAVAAYRNAIASKPDYAEAHCNLGQIHRRAGRFPEALKWLRRGHALGSARRSWKYDSGRWLRACERRVLQDARRAAIQGLDQDRGELREKAADGLGAILKGWGDYLARDFETQRIARSLTALRKIDAFTAFRDAETLDELPPAEREQWRSLWRTLDALHERAKGKQ